MFEFFRKTLWTCKLSQKTYVTRKLLNALRITVLSIRCFLANNCALRASALTFYTLLSVVPVMALGFAVAKGFGLDKKLEQWLYQVLSEQPDIAERIITFAANMLDGAKGGVIAGVGAIMLLYSTVRLMVQAEAAFNGIWGIHSHRPILRQLSDYLSLAFLCPIVIGVTSSVTAFATSHMALVSGYIPFLKPTHPLSYICTLFVFPFFLTWLLFTFIYIFLPNTKVHFTAAAAGALAAGILYHLVQGLYFAAQYTVGKYNAIYGGFAALPLFLLWLQVSWTIILYGSELAFSFQNVSSYEGSPGDGTFGQLRRTLYALKIMRLCSINFESGFAPLSEPVISSRLEIPIRAARSVLFDLVRCGMLVTVVLPDESVAYQITRPTERITPVSVLRSLQENDSDSELSPQDPALLCLTHLWNGAASLAQNKPLTQIRL